MTFPKWLLYINSVSTTNLRIYVSCLVVIGTAVRYWATGVPPVEAWLWFLGGYAGVDVAHYTAKRMTFDKTVGTTGGATISNKNPEEEDGTATTDVQELSQNSQKG
jgi:hypothetical protein